MVNTIEVVGCKVDSTVGYQGPHIKYYATEKAALEAASKLADLHDLTPCNLLDDGTCIYYIKL